MPKNRNRTRDRRRLGLKRQLWVGIVQVSSRTRPGCDSLMAVAVGWSFHKVRVATLNMAGAHSYFEQDRAIRCTVIGLGSVERTLKMADSVKMADVEWEGVSDPRFSTAINDRWSIQPWMNCVSQAPLECNCPECPDPLTDPEGYQRLVDSMLQGMAEAQAKAEEAIAEDEAKEAEAKAEEVEAMAGGDMSNVVPIAGHRREQ